jgi:hypothetical protein
MNRKSMLILLVGAVVFPYSLVSASPKGRPSRRPSCKDCKKCDRACKCECSKGCKCKPGCCKQGESPSKAHQKPRGFDERTPSFQPPNSRPPSGFDRRTPGFGPPSLSRSPQGRPPQGRPSPDKDSRYKEIIRKFDKNKDGKLDEKERDEAKKYFMSRYRNYKK